MNNFVHLHLHSHYSLLDASAHVNKITKHVLDHGMHAVALTDHGNMFGAVELWREATKNKIKPIIGCELYVSTGDHRVKTIQPGQKNYHHLVVLALNKVGYKNLCKIISESYINGFYYKPRVSLEFLAKYSEGLFATSACMASHVAQTLLKTSDEAEALRAARGVVDDLINIFTTDRFRLELQDHGIPEQEFINHRMIKLSRITNIPLVFTNDCHFITKDDFEPHKYLKCIQGGQSVHTAKHVYKPDHRIKSPDEMYELINKYPVSEQNDLRRAMSETVNISDQVDFNFTKGVYHFPEFKDKDTDKTPIELFRERCLNGFKNKSKSFDKTKLEEYITRLGYEMGVITQMGFQSYFLIVSDIINYAKSNNIMVGPGRGSAAGSLVSYCLGITDLDPIKHELLFERFLNPERVSMPDIDIDFSKRHRQNVIDYIIEKYGRSNVAQIITFGTLKPRAALKDMARVYGWSVQQGAALASLVPHTPGNPYTLDKVYNEFPDVKNLLTTSQDHMHLWNLATSLEETKRNASIHAAGIVITPDEVDSYAPLFKRADGNDIAAAYEMKDLEEIGLVKIDILGLKTLDLIQDCIKLINEKIDINNINLNDTPVIQTFANGNTGGIFQFESPGIRGVLRKIGPQKFEDLVAVNALYRPGPLDSGMLEQYIARHRGEQLETPLHPDVADILSSTHGVIVFQEQVMRIVQRLGGFSLAESDVMRKAMGKKSKELMEKEIDKFITGGIQKGYTKDEMEHVAENLTTFARYGFNVAHATAYTYLAYQTAFLKTYYPIEFMCALLMSESEDNKFEKVAEYINDSDIEILSPDVNYSNVNFTIEDNKIRYGLASIKNIGVEVANKIITERTKGNYKNLVDFIERNRGLNSRAIESLIYAGATGSLGGHPAEHFKNYPKLIKQNKRVSINQKTLWDDDSVVINAFLEKTPEWTKQEKSKYEKDVLGLWLNNHPLKPYISKETFKITDIIKPNQEVELVCLVNSCEHRVSKSGTEMLLVKLEDFSNVVTGFVFQKKKQPIVLEDFETKLQVDSIVKIKGRGTPKSSSRLEREDDLEYTIIINSVEVLETPYDDTKEPI